MTSFALFCCVIALPIIVLGNNQEWKVSEEPIYSPRIRTSSVINGKKGWIGCYYNSEVCEPDETCVDDHLFGVCRSLEEAPNSALFFHDYKDLSKDWKRLVDTELVRLANEGYGWTDVYTQCVVRATLLASRSSSTRDLSLCQELAKASLAEEREPARPPPRRALTGNEVSESDRRLAALLEAAEAEKRDAAVRLHKYFDRHMIQRRGPIEEEEQEAGGPEAEPFGEEDDADEKDMEDLQSRLRRLELQALREEAERSLRSDRIADLKESEADTTPEDIKASSQLPTAKEQVVAEEKRAAPMGQAHARSKAENMSPQQALSKVRPSKRLDGRHKASDWSEAAAHRASDEAEAEPEAEALLSTATEAPQRVNFRWVYLVVGDSSGKPKKFRSNEEVKDLLDDLKVKLGLDNLYDTFEFKDNEIDFHLPKKWKGKPEEVRDLLKNITQLPQGLRLIDAGLGRTPDRIGASKLAPPRHFLLTFVVCGSVLVIIVAVIVVFFMQRYRFSKDKLYNLTKAAEQGESTEAYQDLCRHRMQARNSEKPEPAATAARAVAGAALARVDSNSAGSARSSTSSWSEEPVHTNMDISTGHLILSYMEEHLNNKEKLEQEWNNLCAYQPDSIKAEIGKREANLSKNRYLDIIPYDGNRVPLKTKDTDGEDYINASYVINHDPKNPQYIVTQGPLANTVAHFWQLVWEQGSIVIVNLTRLVEDGIPLCHKYWPEEGSELYNNYEVHLVSEHVWCEDYLVRSFYLKNVATGETRTVTQFHFLTWPDLKEPASVKALLDFRRKVNKSYKGRSCPIVIHCSDGCGRSGTYTLLDMLLTRLSKGVKEMDISAAVEHLRDQRCEMVKTRSQFEFVLMAIAEEVHAMLKTLPQ